MSAPHPRVVFVCQKNGGKSQMAAALMRDLAGDAIDVLSAGTKPGASLNAQSVESLEQLGIDVGGEYPKALTREMVESADVVVVLGAEAKVDQVPGTRRKRGSLTSPRNEVSRAWTGCGWSGTTFAPGWCSFATGSERGAG